MRENNPIINKTILYRYDKGGNILDKKEYALTSGDPGTVVDTIGYSYDAVWEDKLTSYDGVSITYDSIGNPLSYINGLTFTWDRGRQLESSVKTGLSVSYEYNDRGIRTKKTVGSTVTNYHLMGSRVTWESDGTDTLYYYYNGAGDLFGLSLNGVKYYYVKNAQGDIIRILDESGTVVVEYTYDSWGMPVSTTGSAAATVGALNPYRYRSYRYDTETGLYYLNSRYYDPEVGRFINADHAAVSCFTPMGLTDKNLFAYCDNNPVV